jgi:hypothetical protein
MQQVFGGAPREEKHVESAEHEEHAESATTEVKVGS